MAQKTIPESAFLPIDEEEARLMAEIEAWEWRPLSEPEQTREKNLLQIAATNTIAKRAKRQIAIRISELDIERAKQEAERRGMRYQTLISSVIHQYFDSGFVGR